MQKLLASFIGNRVVLAVGLVLAVSTRADVTYTLNFTPSNSAEEQQVADSVAEAVAIINQYGSFNKHWSVYYNAGIPTAEANYTGYIGCGGTRNTRVIFHEGAHTFGMGTTTAYANLISSGVWGGQYGNQAQFDTYNDYTDGLHGDGHAIWPGGFNYDNEDGFIERIWMLRVMAGIRADMGILSYTREADNEVVNVGETAEFAVESPVAHSYQWYKGAVALSDGGDISGATSPTLRIANIEMADAGSYHCAATGAGETLNSRPRQLWVYTSPERVQLDLEGNVTDSASSNNGTAFGSPAYTTGKIGQAIDLDGVNDYIALPSAVGKVKDLTVATWVRWDGGSNWQRIFDFGTGTGQYMFLTPQSGSGTLRLVFKDEVYGLIAEQRIETSVLPTAQWVHVAAVVKDDYATLYVDGEAVGSTFGIRNYLANFLPTQNYIGKSQYSDPLFNGRVDDFRVYSRAFDGSEIWDLWGESANAAPVFSGSPVVMPSGFAGEAYGAPSLTNEVDDVDGDTLDFTKLDGPAWLTVAADGTLSGTPTTGNKGINRFVVRVVDPSGASSDATVEILVEPAPIDYEAGPVAYWDFADAGAADATYILGNGDRIDLDGDGSMDTDDFRIGSTDLSGNGNHLTAWTSSWMKWSSVSTLGDFSMIAANGYPAAGTDSEYNPYLTGIDAELITPSNWTVEATFRPTALGGNQTIVGRDGAYPGTWGNYAALYLSTRGTDLAIEYVDVAGNHYNLQIAAGLSNDTWYHAAATSDGSTLRLWLDGSAIGSLDVSGSADSALARGYGTWSVSRGIFDDGHTDRYTGYVDAVAISGVALEPGSFVITGTWPSRYDFYVDDYGIHGAPFAGDWNSNGIANGMEYYLGFDPTELSAPPAILSWANGYQSIVHPFNASAEGVTGAIEWTTDLSADDWSSTGVSYATNMAMGEVEAALGTTTNQLFVRLKVEE